MASMTVVVGVDGSAESLRAAEWAAREARRHRAPVRLVSAAVVPPHLRDHDAWLPRELAGELRGESVRALRDAVTRTEDLTPRLPVDTRLLTGPPALAVTASGAQALMLVLGARGAGGFKAMTVGSLTRYAAMHAPCPVIVVRDEVSAVRREVVVGIRDPLDTSAALGFAFDEAAVRGATLAAVHSLDWLPAAWRSAGSWRLAEEADGNLAEALAPWQDKYPGVPVRRDVLHDHPGHVLASYSGCADLVVIGRGDSGVGGIQHALLDHARGPVAVVPRQLT
jgi:nucleotide-binding universal stress UspA family protein